MPSGYSKCAPLWTTTDEDYFRDRVLIPQKQAPKQCVATTLAMLTETKPSDFVGKINTQDPVSWSDALRPYDMKLAYCPSDVRKLRHYVEELVACDALFALCYYVADPPEILGEPDSEGWICGSHIVILHRDTILDASGGTSTPARKHSAMDRHTKRIFRVVPASHVRGL